MLKSKKLKTLTAILATALFVSGTNLTPAYAKGLSKAVKKEYVKILKKGCVDDNWGGMRNTRFNIVDLNNDGKDDLIVETSATPRGLSSCDVYLNFGNKIRKAKIIGVGVNGPFGQGSGESGGIFATDGIKLYKNYVMGAMHFWVSSVASEDYEIYRIDKKGNLNLAYTHHYEFDEMSSKKSNKYHKIVNGKPKRISKNEYKKFASKFKEVKKEWHRWDLENIKEHVSSIKTDSNVTGKKHSVKAKVKMPERAVDGSRIIEVPNIDAFAIATEFDDKYIYYSLLNGSFNSRNSYAFKRDIKTGNEVGFAKTLEKTGSYAGFTNIKALNNYLICEVYPSGYGIPTIYKVYKNGKFKKLANGSSLLVIGNSMYYLALKLYGEAVGPYAYDRIGVYKMDMNGENKRLVKKGTYDEIGVSGKNIYYAEYSYPNKKWYNLKTGKREKKVILSHLYDPVTKTRFTFKGGVLKAGKYKNGKWKYKTIFTGDYISAARVVGSKIWVQKNVKDGSEFELYMLDLNGKNKKLIGKGGLAG